MLVKQAQFSGCFVNLNSLPQDQLPEIALVGRSNVGKSSLINKFVNQKGLAKSSSTPGKTRTINYYLINKSWYMVDLPGYGYAKVSQQEKKRWGKMIENYLQGRPQLRGVIMLLDIRHSPNDNDLAMKEWLMHSQIPLLLVATKADKISRGQRLKHLKVINQILGLDDYQTPICFSAQNGDGLELLKEALSDLLDNHTITNS